MVQTKVDSHSTRFSLLTEDEIRKVAKSKDSKVEDAYLFAIFDEKCTSLEEVVRKYTFA